MQVTTVESERFFALVIGDDGEGAIACIDALRGRGVSYDTVCSDLLVPAARRLGACWGDDTATFVEVTLGMRRLHESLRHLGDRAPCAESPVGLRALLVPAPGEQHTFGVAMVQASFRRAGWDVAGGIPDSAGEVGCSVRGEHFDVAGLSASRDDQVETVASCVRAVRRSSCNPAIVVMVGGRAFADNPMLVVRVGADAVAADAAEAPGAAARLVAGRQARSA